jgi:thiamine-monophosphate kinase
VGEFSLIQRYFERPAKSRQDKHTALSIGDDAAVVRVPHNHQLVLTIDTLVEGRHFPVATDPRCIAYKSLAVNVSDLAAMAATPAWFLLSLTLPDVDDDFLSRFSAGLFEAADEFGIHLIGGDTCKGPLSISIQATGYVPMNGYITRANARIGDRIFVSGNIGTAALGLAVIEGKLEIDSELKKLSVQALNQPRPRIDMIPLLRQFASAAIDLSDGLIGDLQHILEQSGVGATLDQSRLPVLDIIREQDLYPLALNGGDDYQILFTVRESEVEAVAKFSVTENIDITEIGVICETGYTMQTSSELIDLSQQRGFDHFVEG